MSLSDAQQEIQTGRRWPRLPTASVVHQIQREMVGGLLLAAGIEERVEPKLLQLGEDRYGARGATLGDIAREVLGLVGAVDPINSVGRIEAAFSTATGADVLSTAVNTAFMSAYQSSPDSTAGWLVEREVSDFKTNRRLRASYPEKLEPLPRGGEASHVSVNLVGAESYRAIRYARQFTVDAQDAVSEDVDAILQPAMLLGRGAVRLKLDLVYSELLANGALADAVALFHSTHGNLDTTATLSATTLDAAIAGMSEQTEADAPLNVAPRFVLVPAALAGLARRLVRDMTTASENLIVRSEPRLGLGVTDPVDGTSYSGSTTSWYLAAANNVPTIEFGYRSPRPEITRYLLNQGRWGLGFSINWDVGAKTLDYRGLHRADA